MSRERPPANRNILTPREWEVLELVADGYTDREIASRLSTNVGGVTFQLAEILGKLRLSSREDAARWYRERYPRAPLWAPVGEWVRTAPRWAPQASAAGATALAACALAIAAWGLAHPSRPPGPVPTPIVIRAPGYLSDAHWANDGRWIVAFDVRTNRQTIVDREFREISTLREGTQRIPEPGSGIGSTFPPEVHYASLADTRVATSNDPHTVTIWDAATGEVLEELIRVWDLPNNRFTLLDGAYRHALGLPEGALEPDPWFDRAIVMEGNAVTVWDASGKVFEMAGVEQARTDVTITRDGRLRFKGQQEAEAAFLPSPFSLKTTLGRASDLPAPSPSLAASHCGIWFSPSVRFAVVQTCEGGCRLVDISKDTVGDGWEIGPGDQVIAGPPPRQSLVAPPLPCGIVSWSEDEREVLVSTFSGS